MNIYCYPFKDVNNRYINKNIDIWEGMGIKCESIWKALKLSKIPKKDKTIILNWFEDWTLNVNYPLPIALLKSITILTLLRMSCGRIIWVQHNFKPHNTQTKSKCHDILRQYLSIISNNIVTHRPVKQIKSTVIPHPLVTNPQISTERNINYLWFGTIKPYKGISELLNNWPKNIRLHIAGRCTDENLISEINSIIKNRNLLVTWENKYLEDRELDALIKNSKHVIISNLDNSMIVSGVFYHAISLGANILIRAGELGNYLAAKHTFVSTFIPIEIEKSIYNAKYISPAIINSNAIENYGDQKCRASWQAVLSK